jgi:[ribosomal protein S18]-alanine N-acetyltransferase
VSLQIRPMQQGDIDRVLEVAAESVEAPGWARAVYEKLLTATPDGVLRASAWVAEREDQVVGFAVARWLAGEPAAEIESLAVAQRYRRQNIGTTLVKRCMSWAACAGAIAVRLEVRQSNAAAQALYRALGFAVAGVRRAYYAAPVEDACVLEAPARSSR